MNYENERQQKYKEGIEFERGEKDAGKLIDVWVAANGRAIPWAKAVEIMAICNGISNEDKAKLLALDE